MKNISYINQHTDLAIKSCQYTEEKIKSVGEPEFFCQFIAYRNADGELEIDLSWAGKTDCFSKAGILDYIKQRLLEE